MADPIVCYTLRRKQRTRRMSTRGPKGSEGKSSKSGHPNGLGRRYHNIGTIHRHHMCGNMGANCQALVQHRGTCVGGARKEGAMGLVWGGSRPGLCSGAVLATRGISVCTARTQASLGTCEPRIEGEPRRRILPSGVGGTFQKRSSSRSNG